MSRSAIVKARYIAVGIAAAQSSTLMAGANPGRLGSAARVVEALFGQLTDAAVAACIEVKKMAFQNRITYRDLTRSVSIESQTIRGGPPVQAG